MLKRLAIAAIGVGGAVLPWHMASQPKVASLQSQVKTLQAEVSQLQRNVRNLNRGSSSLQAQINSVVSLAGQNTQQLGTLAGEMPDLSSYAQCVERAATDLEYSGGAYEFVQALQYCSS